MSNPSFTSNSNVLNTSFTNSENAELHSSYSSSVQNRNNTSQNFAKTFNSNQKFHKFTSNYSNNNNFKNNNNNKKYYNNFSYENKNYNNSFNANSSSRYSDAISYSYVIFNLISKNCFFFYLLLIFIIATFFCLVFSININPHNDICNNIIKNIKGRIFDSILKCWTFKLGFCFFFYYFFDFV
jgi:hypothetical protein